MTALPLSLHPYQQAAIEHVHRAWESDRSTLLVLPTGTGKTVVMARLAAQRAKFGRVLVLAHMRELITQTADKFARWAPDLRVAIEMGEQRAFLGGFYPPDVVVASRQSISRSRRLARFPEDAFGSVFVDEAHHATASEYVRVLERFPKAKVLGVTATPDRGDEEALGKIFESVAYAYELRQAIDDGWLVPIVQKSVRVAGLDFSKIRTVAGDLDQGALEEQLRKDEHLHSVAEPVAELAKGRKTIVFTVTVAHAYDLARVLRGYGVTAEALDGTSSQEQREKVLAQFRDGRVQVLCNCSLFTEGFDLPQISAVAIARPTKSRSLYAQMVGRGTRLAEGKADVLVLDFRGNAGKHVLVNPLDILGGKMTPEERTIAEEILAANPGAKTTDAIDQAKKQAEERARMIAEAQRQREAKLAVGTYKDVREVDPFGMRAIGIEARALQWGDKPASEWERTRLLRLKYPKDQIGALTSDQAKEVIKKLEARRAAGLATYAQARTLAKYGFENAAEISFEDAGKYITRIAANHWKLPDDLKKRRAG